MGPLEIKGKSQKNKRTVLTKSHISQPLIDLEYKTWNEINVKTMHYSTMVRFTFPLIFGLMNIYRNIQN